jgi:hypothetical protein
MMRASHQRPPQTSSTRSSVDAHGDARQAERPLHAHTTAVRSQVLELEEVRLEAPVIAEIGEELEERVGWVCDLPRRGDRAAYQPRVSSSSSGRSAAADRPLIASPSPRDTRARMSASV